MKIKVSELRSVINEEISKFLKESNERSPKRGLTRDDLYGEYSDTYKALTGRRYRNEDWFKTAPIADLENALEALHDELKNKDVNESQKKGDHDGDGDVDFADIMMARRMASGESKEKARKKTRKHDK